MHCLAAYRSFGNAAAADEQRDNPFHFCAGVGGPTTGKHGGPSAVANDTGAEASRKRMPTKTLNDTTSSVPIGPPVSGIWRDPARTWR